MQWFVRRLTAGIAVAVAAMAVGMFATPAIGSAECDRNMSWNRTTEECKPPPPLPDWYTAPPDYAPEFAAQDVPPPLRRGHGGHRTNRCGMPVSTNGAPISPAPGCRTDGARTAGAV